jgi:dethiobiotin synthetase
VAGLILLPLLLVASGALGAFNHSYRTLAYLRLTNVSGGHLPQCAEGT